MKCIIKNVIRCNDITFSIEINSSIIKCKPKIEMGFSMSHRRDVAGMFWLETIPSLSD